MNHAENPRDGLAILECGGLPPLFTGIELPTHSTGLPFVRASVLFESGGKPPHSKKLVRPWPWMSAPKGPQQTSPGQRPGKRMPNRVCSP
jgi:hypothetical protein